MLVERGLPARAGARVFIAACHEAAKEQMFSHEPNHSYVDVASGRCVPLGGSGSGVATLQPCTGADNQQQLFQDRLFGVVNGSLGYPETTGG